MPTAIKAPKTPKAPRKDCGHCKHSGWDNGDSSVGLPGATTCEHPECGEKANEKLELHGDTRKVAIRCKFYEPRRPGHCKVCGTEIPGYEASHAFWVIEFYSGESYPVCDAACKEKGEAQEKKVEADYDRYKEQEETDLHDWRKDDED